MVSGCAKHSKPLTLSRVDLQEGFLKHQAKTFEMCPDRVLTFHRLTHRQKMLSPIQNTSICACPACPACLSAFSPCLPCLRRLPACLACPACPAFTSCLHCLLCLPYWNAPASRVCCEHILTLCVRVSKYWNETMNHAIQQ